MGWVTDNSGNTTYIGDRGDNFDYGNSYGSNDSYQQPLASSIAVPPPMVQNANTSFFNSLDGDTASSFAKMGITNDALGNHKLTPTEVNAINYSNSQNGMSKLDRYNAAKTRNMNAGSALMEEQAKRAGEFDYGGAINVGLGAAQTAMNIGSFFDNRKFNKERLSALQENRQYTKQANQRKTDFHNAAKSVFA
jgi:hypothetical protein